MLKVKVNVYETGRSEACVEALEGEQVGVVPVVCYPSPLYKNV